MTASHGHSPALTLYFCLSSELSVALISFLRTSEGAVKCACSRAKRRLAWWPVQEGRRARSVLPGKRLLVVQLRNVQQQHPTLRDFRLLLETLGESFMLSLATLDDACLAPGPVPQAAAGLLDLISSPYSSQLTYSHAPYHLLGCD